VKEDETVEKHNGRNADILSSTYSFE